jgi:hypothetical protein
MRSIPHNARNGNTFTQRAQAGRHEGTKRREAPAEFPGGSEEVSAIVIVFSFLPTADVESLAVFESKLVGGCILFYVLARWCYLHYRMKAA